ncbi:zinc finger protein 40 [Echinococcus multilocularis]|uniref:Zinc finger protein 40 n=1 Tax=Echinococcus multilocularis TaxID=6211 RepID=A0A068YAA6_ECHMU|nr:zinc finger protein 40 [Echinococcus multilocularis]
MDTFSIAALAISDQIRKIPKPKPPQWMRPSPIATGNHLPSVNNVFAEIFRLLTLPHTPPLLPPLLPPPPTSLSICLMNREKPLDLSRKAATVASGSDTIQRRVKAINGTYHHNRNHHHHHHHHHHGSGKQPIPRCFECKRLFPTLWDLNIHFLGEHQSTLQREFTQNRSWKTCSLENISVHQLQTTLRRGAVERTGYPCPHCDYFAKWPTELQKHIMVHSKERPHQCVICGLTYKWKWDLGRHFDKSHHHAVNPNLYTRKKQTDWGGLFNLINFIEMEETNVPPIHSNIIQMIIKVSKTFYNGLVQKRFDELSGRLLNGKTIKDNLM